MQLKLEFRSSTEGRTESPARLERMMEGHNTKAQKARLYSECWRTQATLGNWTKAEVARHKARQLHRELWEETGNAQHRERLAELDGTGVWSYNM